MFYHLPPISGNTELFVRPKKIPEGPYTGSGTGSSKTVLTIHLFETFVKEYLRKIKKQHHTNASKKITANSAHI